MRRDLSGSLTAPDQSTFLWRRPPGRIWCRLFYISMVAFGFSVFGSLPAGFTSTFSVLAFILAVPIFIREVRSYRWHQVELTGLYLFSWLALSILWSEGSVTSAIVFLLEYRIYFMVPILAAAMRCCPGAARTLAMAVVGGCLFSLIASYCIYLGLLSSEAGVYSLGYKIFHGFVMSLLYLASLAALSSSHNFLRWVGP